MTEALCNSHHVIFCEMMSHPVLFSHPHPKIVGILGDEEHHILMEVIKHSHLTEIHHLAKQPHTINDTRVAQHPSDVCLTQTSAHAFDIIINANQHTLTSSQHAFNALQGDGLLLQLADSPFYADSIKNLVTELKNIGFHDFHILQFPQPHYPSGWRMAVIALKYGVFKRLREKAIYNKTFKTHYYNFDIHRAAMALPEFMREAVN